ncbi:hypothetical protein KRR26_17825 [Corallococcus sp. M34]|nr:hypothetical protein [Citreicoccus inhibens]
MNITEGKPGLGPGDVLHVNEPRLRAVVLGPHGSDVALRFTWLGDSSVTTPLASGEMRKQLGIKLRALDGCNVIYAMWRIAPRPGIVVNYKRNPTLHTSGECGNQGYSVVAPQQQIVVPALRAGVPHTLHARIEGTQLKVWADGALVWTGVLPTDALTLLGPGGLRTDNVRATLELFTH